MHASPSRTHPTMRNRKEGAASRRSKTDNKQGTFPPAPGWPRFVRGPERSFPLAVELALLAEGDWQFQPLLWQRARDVVLWAGTPPEARGGLFEAIPPEWRVVAERQASQIERLAQPVRVLSVLARYPEFVQAEEVSAACLAVSDWADENLLPETALTYAEVACHADPRSARAAAHAGQLCAYHATDDRAEVWYERGIKIGRRTKAWEWHVRSNLRLGILRYEQGRFRSSQRCCYRALSIAEWQGLTAFAGKAHHDLLRISIAMTAFRRGNEHARKALELYPRSYERLPYLAHDYAILLCDCGFDAEALEILDRILPRVLLPYERIVILGTIAKAAAGIGDVFRHRTSVEDVLLLASMSDLNAAGALALSAEGAHALGEWDRVAHLARMSIQIATRRREREPQRRAGLVLDAVARRESACASRSSDRELAVETTAMFLARLHELEAAPSSTDAGAVSRARSELVKFTIAGR